MSYRQISLQVLLYFTLSLASVPYLVLLQPGNESQKSLERGEHVAAWDGIGDEEIIAIVPLE